MKYAIKLNDMLVLFFFLAMALSPDEKLPLREHNTANVHAQQVFYVTLDYIEKKSAFDAQA